MVERTAICAQAANAVLGEGPVFDERSGCLFWLDIRRGQIFRHHVESGRQTGQWVLPGRAGCLALTQDETRLLVTAGGTLLALDLSTGDLLPLAEPERDRPLYRFNDGAVDPRGRLWLGSMIDDFHAPQRFEGGRLYRFDAERGIACFGEDYQLPNGIGWSPDGTRMYLNDTVAMTTYVFDYDPDTGLPGNRRALIAHEAEGGFPDGLAIDVDGHIWSAMWDGWCLTVHDADGRLLERLPMPVRRPSSVAFGGAALDQLFVTSATVDFTTRDYLQSPEAGGLFRLPAGRRGLAAGRFAGIDRLA